MEHPLLLSAFEVVTKEQFEYSISSKAAIAVVGPTGVGKTEIAIYLAGEINGEIVSCDSVQLYRFLDIGSAKPSPEEQSLVSHHMIDEFDPDYRIDVGVYKSLAERDIIDIHSRDKIPLITGGTGLYFNSLYYGLISSPSRSAELRIGLEKRASIKGLGEIYKELQIIDPGSAGKILPNDKRRIIRALEVYYLTGVPISKMKETNKKLGLNWYIIGLNRERKDLYERVEARIDKMIEEGLIEETRGIISKFGREAFALGSIGYRHALKYLDGEWNLEVFLRQLKQDTRHYAKRQITWFKKNKDIHWYHPDQKKIIIEDVKKFLAGN